MLAGAGRSTVKNLFLSSRFFSTMERKTMIGVNILLIKDNKILLGQRLNSIQALTWGAPAGRLECGETLIDCARREAKEETGLELTRAELLTSVTGVFKELNIPYRSYFVLGTYEHGEPRTIEPHKCREWQWFDLTKLPSPLFDPIQNWLDNHADIQSLLNLSKEIPHDGHVEQPTQMTTLR